MTATVVARLGGILAVVALGWLATRLGWLGPQDPGPVLSSAAFTVFVPALLFQTTAGVDLGTLPWTTLAAFFGPALVCLLAVYAIARARADRFPAGAEVTAAGPAVQAITVAFGNTVQVGIPVVVAVYGQPGLRVLIPIVSLHALTILTVVTALAEVDLARAGRIAGGARGTPASAAGTVAATARRTLIHPVVLPVLAGLAVNLAGITLPSGVTDVLTLLGQAVVPICLILIGVSLARHADREALGPAAVLGAAKLTVLPAAVLATGHLLLGLRGVPLQVAVLTAALPVGSNALLFAQRYRALEGRTTTAIVLSTTAFPVTLALWLATLAAVH